MSGEVITRALLSALGIILIAAAGAGALSLFDTPPSSWPAGDHPRAIDAADVNGDQLVDIVVANVDADEFTVLLNAGGGEFPVPYSYRANDEEPRDVVLADLDSQDCIDLVIPCTGDSDNGWTEIFLNDCAGFIHHQAFTGGAGPWRALVAEFDGRPGLDIAVSYPWSGEIGVALNDGAGGFEELDIYEVVAHPAELEAGDFNQDGHLDIATTGSEPNNHWAVVMNDGEGAFALGNKYYLPDIPKAVVTGDFDGDKKDDVAVGVFGPSQGQNLLVYFGLGGGDFSPPVGYGSLPCVINMVGEDFDRDGDLDLAIVGLYDDYLAILYNDGEGGFPWREQHGTSPGPYDLVAADVDGDGNSDIIVVNADSDVIEVFLNGYPTAVEEAGAAPATRIEGSFPNPFNPVTRIRYRLAEAGPAELAVFTTEGRRIRTLAKGFLPAGSHELSWDGRDERGQEVSAGLYLLRLGSLKGSDTRKLTLLK